MDYMEMIEPYFPDSNPCKDVHIPSVKEVTGWDTMNEYLAFQKGYEAHEKLMMEWIAKWDGGSNSALGALINAKILALEAGNTDPIDSNQPIIIK